jgi:hypothetical protein
MTVVYDKVDQYRVQREAWWLVSKLIKAFSGSQEEI